MMYKAGSEGSTISRPAATSLLPSASKLDPNNCIASRDWAPACLHSIRWRGGWCALLLQPQEWQEHAPMQCQSLHVRERALRCTSQMPLLNSTPSLPKSTLIGHVSRGLPWAPTFSGNLYLRSPALQCSTNESRAPLRKTKMSKQPSLQ